jgi:HSP20 family protein
MLSITRFNSPVLSDVQALQRRLGRLLDEAFQGTQEGNGALIGWLPPVDVLEDKDAVHITVELPGVKTDDVKISMENNVLTIRGEKRQSAEENTEHVHRYERSFGVFERSFTVPSTVDADHIQASYDLGVLTVRLPKVEKAKPRQIDVKVAAAK